MNPYYKDYSEYLQEIFPGLKVQKISLNAGFSCPNRDGTISRGGCIYCLNDSFTPSYCMQGNSIAEQLKQGIGFFSRKYPRMKYLAYFQSFTNTHAPISELRPIYEQALLHPDVVGMIIGTRPDTLPTETVNMLAELNTRKPVFIELGAETSFDNTLKAINRGHSWNDVVTTTRRLADSGLRHVGLHLICGLPGEGKEEFLTTVRRAAGLPIESLKMHHLQVLRGTELERMLLSEETEIWKFTSEEYLEICCQAIKAIPRNICIERFLASAPPGLVVSPQWGIKNHEFTDKLLQHLNLSRPTALLIKDKD